MLRMRARLAASTRLLPSSGLVRGFGKGAIVAGLLMASLPNAVAQMSLPGDFAVTSSGGANYKIQIVVPTGTAGMVPSLSLEYSSETGGNANGWLGAGLLGVGWSLGGLSAIARCPQTVAQDGALVAVNYTSSDRFCLEGQRLIATSGAYGADGTVYGTEVESFSLIISHGTSGTGPGAGPAWFEVHTKSGQVLQFGNTSGNTSNSQILVQGTTTVRSWAVNKVSDSAGNYYTVTYQPDTANGQTYPLQINYTANDSAGLAAYNSVQFVYATRPDITPIYQAGSLMQTTMRLTDVQTYNLSTLVADYQLLYQQGSATGRSQLYKVTLCGAGGVCLPATTFTWQNGTTTPTVISNVASADNTPALVGARPYLADFNGNGRTAILWDKGGDSVLPYSTGTDTRVLWSFTGTGNTVTSTSNFAGIDNTLTGYVPIVGDFNRDGRADIWWYALVPNPNFGGPTTYQQQAAGPTSKLLSNSDGTYTLSDGPALPVGQSDAYRFLAEGDLNGDGRSDLIWIHQVTSDLHATVREWLLNPDGSVTTSLNDAGSVAASNGLGPGSWLAALGAADFNGDGFTDLLWTSNGSFTYSGSGADGLWLSKGDGRVNPVPVDGTSVTGFTSVTGYTPFFGDFNGDGKTDILWVTLDGSGRSTGQPIFWMSRGDGTFVANSTPGGLNGSTVAGCIPTIADFNGDGIADILWVPAGTDGRSSGQPLLSLGKGDGTFTTSSVGSTLAGYVAYIGDFNGDGKADVLWDSRNPNDSRSTGTRVIWLSDGVAPDLMKGVTNGLGATVAITYSSITNNTKDNNGNIIVVYTKGATATDPTVDVQAPMQVVSRVDKSNGVGGIYSTTYTYAGAQFDNNGRGFLGFHQFSATDQQTGIVQTTIFLQSFPFIMQVASDTKTLGSTILSSTINTYGTPSLSAPYRVTLNQTQTSGADLDGSALPTTTSTFTYDAYNNAKTIAVSINDGSTKTTTNTFNNDTTYPHWYLGRLITSSVTSAAP